MSLHHELWGNIAKSCHIIFDDRTSSRYVYAFIRIRSMTTGLALTISGLAVTVLSILVTIILHLRSENKTKPKITGRFAIREWPLITPVDHFHKHGAATTFQLVLSVFNISVPPRTLFLRNARVQIWPKFIPFLAREYSLDDPWLGDTPENAHKTISPDSIEEFHVNPDPFIIHVRNSRWPWAFVARVTLKDETGEEHVITFSIDRELSERLKAYSTRDEYFALFQ